MQGELAQVQWVALHMQGASLPLHPLLPVQTLPLENAEMVHKIKNVNKNIFSQTDVCSVKTEFYIR